MFQNKPLKAVFFLVITVVISTFSYKSFAEKQSDYLTEKNSEIINKKKHSPEYLTNVLENDVFKKVGETKFSVFIWDIYQSQLHTTSGSFPVSNTDEKTLYQITYLKSISSEDLVSRTVEQWQHIGISTKQYEQYLPVLRQIWPDIKTGDSLALLIDQEGSKFYYNQEVIGSINTKEFGPMFLDIWLAKNTSQPKLRNELLGKVNHGQS